MIDGNRRLLSALTGAKEKILAAIAEPTAEPALFEHWVPTSLLVDLVFWHKREAEEGRNTTQVYAGAIAELIRNSAAARYEFARHSIHGDEETHILLLNAVGDILSREGITLDV